MVPLLFSRRGNTLVFSFKIDKCYLSKKLHTLVKITCIATHDNLCTIRRLDFEFSQKWGIVRSKISVLMFWGKNKKIRFTFNLMVAAIQAIKYIDHDTSPVTYTSHRWRVTTGNQCVPHRTCTANSNISHQHKRERPTLGQHNIPAHYVKSSPDQGPVTL